ncbi:MAG: bacillithiol biosynthesis cysteine-adding enzyme BshC [Saprospiraceae bacterium]|nr:bacillithiol biosynthesis cysteine-adding enzyme BshC [Candidatus Vicinibacter affinis]
MNKYSSTYKLISPDSITQFKKMDLDYWMHPEKFSEFINLLPLYQNIPEQINQKNSNYTHRDEWYEIIKKQYAKISISDPIHHQINRFKNNNCFAITCAHQPCMLGGPLYWWIKIAQTIKISRELNKLYPQFHFVPVYFSGNEDHDLDEINHFWLFNNKIIWPTNQKGPVGKMNLVGLKEMFDDVMSYFTNNEDAKNLIGEIQQFLNVSESYGDFMMHFVHYLFGSYGLVYFNPDQIESKKILLPVLAKEFADRISVHYTADKIMRLESLGYPIQAKPREINIFYISDQYRGRIVFEGEKFATHDQVFSWTNSELLSELNTYPERFSPNVLLRPVYQESLIPNLMFIGGGAEIAYWLQLKDLFNHCNVTFPILKRRASVMMCSSSLQKRIANLGLELNDFLNPTSIVEEKLLHLKSDFPHEIEQIRNDLLSGFEDLVKLSNTNFKSGNTSLIAEIKKIEHSIEKLFHRLFKEEKLKFETDVTKVTKIKEVLFPDNLLQERRESGIQYFIQNGRPFIDDLIENIPGEGDKLVLLLEN